MKLFILLISINAFGQSIDNKQDTIANNKILYLNKNTERTFLYKFDMKDYGVNFQKIPHNKKIDFSNPNYPKYNYDIYNPNKSNDLMGFLLSGITNLF